MVLLYLVECIKVAHQRPCINRCVNVLINVFILKLKDLNIACKINARRYIDMIMSGRMTSYCYLPLDTSSTLACSKSRCLLCLWLEANVEHL